jgi:hypothetical protein
MITLQTFMPYYMISASVLMIANIVWAFRDARSRGRSGVLIALLVLWTFPLGVILWLIFRPPLSDDLQQEPSSSDDELKARANAGLL